MPALPFAGKTRDVFANSCAKQKEDGLQLFRAQIRLALSSGGVSLGNLISERWLSGR